MVKTYLLPVNAGTGAHLFRHWWQWVFVAIALTAIVIGTSCLCFKLIRKIYQYCTREILPSDVLHQKIANHLQKYASSRSQVSLEQTDRTKPTSLGIYLGPFEKPITPSQARLFSEKDTIILNPLEQNVIAALGSLQGDRKGTQHIIGRIDLGEIVNVPAPKGRIEEALISGLDQIMNIVLTRFLDSTGQNNGFTGILLGSWDVLPTPVLHGLSDVLSGFGLEVYLETSPPNFIEDPFVLGSSSISGLVVRNGIIQGNGERRDCFDMEVLRMTVKGFVAQSCFRDFNVFFWETLDDNVIPSNAILKRTFTWCSFYSALPWIGQQSALYDSTVDVVPFEPFSAFDWLKDSRVMELHDLWKSKRSVQEEYPLDRHSVVGQLNELFPTFGKITYTDSCKHEVTKALPGTISAQSENLDWFILKDTALGDPLCISPTGGSFDGFGCFPLGVDVNTDDFQEIVLSQKRMRKLELLDAVSALDLREYGAIFSRFIADTDVLEETTLFGAPCNIEPIEDLARTLNLTLDDRSDGVRVFLGLHSGFQRTSDKQFWAVYNTHGSGTTDIYISKNAHDVVGTLLHTFLSSRGFTRRQCLAAETSLAKWQNTLALPHQLPQRVVQDISLLTPDECILLLQRVALAPDAASDLFLQHIKSGIMERLVDAPTLTQLNTLNTVGYLNGEAKIEDLIATRIQWHCQCKRPHPELAASVSMFHEVERKIFLALKSRNRQDLNDIVNALGQFLRHSTVDAIGDIFAMAVFSTMRKLAFEEVYVEVTDRNPLFNDQADQAAAFAELFALGSRCEAYFDITPSQFGTLLSNKFREYYGQPEHQPPEIKDGSVALSSAYAEAQIDVDPKNKSTEMPAYQRFTFLSVFAIPALIDIVMLTTTGHGLYLSGKMSDDEQHSATVALMISLLLSGAIGTWITCGGTYYLASMAFSAMNYFVVTRLLGGFAFTLIAGLIGFVAFTCTTGAHTGLVFLLYMIGLTTYLCLLAALANYQFTGSAFQSGRATIILCIPVLFVSPIVTFFVPNHDVIVYLTVLYVFILLLLLGVRRTGSRWTTWYQKIALVNDVTMRKWYLDQMQESTRKDVESMSDPAVLRLARQSLLRAVLKERHQIRLFGKCPDPVVARLAKAYPATTFLMDWYCKFNGVAKPSTYSSSWNGQTKVALDSLQKSQLGIRFHNGFLHWRQAGDEIGCTMLYFILALLDKWVSLIDGGQVLGIGSSNVNLRMPVGFGLAYYLVGAVLLDFNAHKLHELAGRDTEDIVPTDAGIAAATKSKSDKRKALYWKTLSHYLMWHIWGLAVSTTMIWIFARKYQEMIIYLAYVGAYTGLLWYQYTKIFCGPHALKPLLIGVGIGLPVGFILENTKPDFMYSDVIALATATWTVAILSMWAGKIFGQPDTHIPKPSHGSYHSYSGPGSDEAWSQPELKGLYEHLSELPKSEKLHIDPNSAFGHEVSRILTQCSQTKLTNLAQRAFPQAEALLEISCKLFREAHVRVELVSVDHFSKYDHAMRAVSFTEDAIVTLLVGCETRFIAQGQDPLPGFYQEVVELLIQVSAERYSGYSSRDSVLAQTLWLDNSVWSDASAGPSVLERQLKINAKAGKAMSLLEDLQKQLLKDLCLGVDPDIEWEDVPSDGRKFLIDRCLGVVSAITTEQSAFLEKKITSSGLTLQTYIARCDYAAFTSALALTRAASWVTGDVSTRHHFNENLKSLPILPIMDLHENTSRAPVYSGYDKLLLYSGAAYHYLGTLCKFFSVAFVADPEYQREVMCTFPGDYHVGNILARGFFLGIWMMSKKIQQILLPAFLFYDRDNVRSVWKNMHGMEVSFKRKRVLMRNLDGMYTGFIHPIDAKTFKLLQYRGDHDSEPSNTDQLVAINMYSINMALQRRVEMVKGATINDYVYDYRNVASDTPKRLSRTDLLTTPITRQGVAGQNAFQAVNYNLKGQIESGSYMKDGNLVRFQYHYQKAPKHSGALLRAEFVLPHLSCTVSWCAPPRRHPEKLETWIPHSQVTEATFVVGADVWESKYFYDHKFHPTIMTTLNGQRVDTPPLIMYDHLDVLKRPKHVSFLDDNPLFSFSTFKFNPVTRFLGFATRHYPVPTSQTRSWLWKAWREDPSFDGVIVRWLDERLLRRDPVLSPYWRKRDIGHLHSAEEYLDQNRDAVMASVDLDNSISNLTPLAIKINDLYTFGQGGDAVSRTRSNITAQEEDETALHVIAVDTGTWPNEGGGVSACRSDVINNLRSIKWHMVAESANDFGIPKRQIERNVHSLKVIPLWGLDLLTPTHGLFSNRLDSEVQHITTHATLLDIERVFVPILEAMITGARAVEFTVSDVKRVTRALVNLNSYFKDTKHWSETWKSDAVKSAWRRLWMSQTASNSRPSSEWLNTELPTLGQLDQGLEIWSRYLFIFSIPIPEKMPAVFQASHHSVSASYGVVCKLKRGCTLQIWDHAISWRETNLYLSSALCPLSPFVRNALLGLMRMTSVLTLHHADTILPCADFFNPNWEIEIGTCQGKIEHRSAFQRKIDPVVNGITSMQRFAPVQEIKSKLPTVTMLSHVWFAKDIKTALLSADIIINKWGFKDYRLDIYGALDKSPTYTTNCQEIIATKSLRHQVALMGEADPLAVLEKTWVFLNSSVSEGLPLALGEAALTGAPIVCTDVGASLRVLTNPEDGSCFSAVVAPNDAYAMARAQIKILALLEEFSQYSDAEACTSPLTHDASFPEVLTEEDIERITKRMYEQSDARRKLGMRSREIVQKSFSGDRYLREHEQMLWVGKARKDMAHPHLSSPRQSMAATQFPLPKAIRISNTSVPPVRKSFRLSIAPSKSDTEGGSARGSRVPGESQLPSLAGGGGRSTLPSVITLDKDRVPSTIVGKENGERVWIGSAKQAQRVSVSVSVLEKGLKREEKNVGFDGLSGGEIIV